MRNLAIAVSMMLVLQAQSSQRQSAEERGTVEGTITRSGTADPVTGAQVRLTSPAVLQRLVDLLSVQGVTVALPPNGVADDAYVQRLLDTVRTRGVAINSPEFQSAFSAVRESTSSRMAAVTDSAGRFVIRDVAPGSYRVSAEREGYFGGTVNSSSNATVTATVVVTAGQTTQMALSMIAGATISGKVVIDAVPQVGATVQAFSISYQNGYQVMQQAVSKTTDDRGEYRLF